MLRCHSLLLRASRHRRALVLGKSRQGSRRRKWKSGGWRYGGRCGRHRVEMSQGVAAGRLSEGNPKSEPRSLRIRSVHALGLNVVMTLRFLISGRCAL
jgi:hypothetical protein